MAVQWQSILSGWIPPLASGLSRLLSLGGETKNPLARRSYVPPCRSYLPRFGRSSSLPRTVQSRLPEWRPASRCGASDRPSSRLGPGRQWLPLLRAFTIMVSPSGPRMRPFPDDHAPTREPAARIRCGHCGESIGMSERMTVVKPGRVHHTTRLTEESRPQARASHYHRACYTSL
jgi:hypothetical protein